MHNRHISSTAGFCSSKLSLLASFYGHAKGTNHAQSSSISLCFGEHHIDLWPAPASSASFCLQGLAPSRISPPEMNLQPSTSDPELHRDFNTIKILLNSQLKDILRNEHLPVSGVKSVLQTRIMNCEQPSSLCLLVVSSAASNLSPIIGIIIIIDLHRLALAGDNSRLARTRQLVRSFFATPSTTTSSSPSFSTTPYPGRSTAATSAPPSTN